MHVCMKSRTCKAHTTLTPTHRLFTFKAHNIYVHDK